MYRDNSRNCADLFRSTALERKVLGCRLRLAEIYDGVKFGPEPASELRAQALLYDAAGRALGVFLPVAEKMRVEDLLLEPPLSIEETEVLRQRARQTPGKPLADILGRLGF
jgi:hypothetical protein